MPNQFLSGSSSTMMACPDMETEGKVLKAINEVKSFDVLSGGGIGCMMQMVHWSSCWKSNK